MVPSLYCFSQMILTLNLYIYWKGGFLSLPVDSNQVPCGVEAFTFTYTEHGISRTDAKVLAPF
jgi:hypothetical protein